MLRNVFIMPVLSWLRLSRRVPGVVRQRELANLEALIDSEAGHEPSRNLFILSCAIPAGIGTFGGLSVFVAWITGNTGLPLVLGSLLTAALAAGAWFIFYRLYRSIPPARRHLRDQILKFSKRYTSFGNIVLGEQCLSDEFSALLDEAAEIYLVHCFSQETRLTGAQAIAVEAIESAMSKLMEVAVLKDRTAQTKSMDWAQPLLVEMRMLGQSLARHSQSALDSDASSPLSRLREARANLETISAAHEELDQHIEIR